MPLYDEVIAFDPQLLIEKEKIFYIEVGTYCKKCRCNAENLHFCADLRRKYKIIINSTHLKAEIVYTAGDSRAFDECKLLISVYQLDKYIKMSFIFNVYMNGKFKHDVYYYPEIDSIIYDRKEEILVSSGLIFYIKIES